MSTSSAEKVYLPLSVKLTPLRRPDVAYSPLPDADDVMESDSDGSVVYNVPVASSSDLTATPAVTSLKKRKRTRSVKKRKKRRKIISKSVLAGSTFLREKKQDYHLGRHVDLYYEQRYERVAQIDPRLRLFLKSYGSNYFLRKNVLDLRCGVGFVAFYVSAFLGASHVTAVEYDFETQTENVRQLRKFKHDGIRLDSSNRRASDDTLEYPSILVKRSGVPRITNKPWVVEPEYSAATTRNQEYSEASTSTKYFPLNIQFEYQPDMVLFTGSVDSMSYPVVLCWGGLAKCVFTQSGEAGVLQLLNNIKSVIASDGIASVELFEQTGGFDFKQKIIAEGFIVDSKFFVKDHEFWNLKKPVG